MSSPEPPRAPGPPPAGPGYAGAPSPTPPSDQEGLDGLRAELEQDVRRIEGENREIDTLMEQVLAEVERHEGRRTKMEARLAQLEASVQPDQAELSEVRDGLLALTRREMLFDAQRQVLEGKQRILARFLQRLAEIDDSLAAMGGRVSRATPVAAEGSPPHAASGGGSSGENQPVLALRSQEDLRRDIVRQLHDGPAQSIANIGLQAEIVERLVQKQDARAVEEIEALRQMVQAALDATKEFIFDIRPMVLDDLGLGPTIRRVSNDRGRRAGINVEFDTRGVEERLEPDIESAVYRSLDESIATYLGLQPPSVRVRLDWGERELVATVEGTWPRDDPELEALASDPGAQGLETPAALLAMMEDRRSAEREADRATRSLPPERLEVIAGRARALGLTLTMRNEGQLMELVAPIQR